VSPRELIVLLERMRFPLHDEKRAQQQIAAYFDRAEVAFRREVRLSDGDIVDFMVGGTAIEVKLKGQRRAILSQLERYAEHAEITALLLVTARSTPLPPTINGKPTHTFSIAEPWL
jgi:hypothetical protein